MFVSWLMLFHTFARGPMMLICALWIISSHMHRGSTGNETWSHLYRRSARWPLENNLNVWWAQVLRTKIFRSSTLQQTTRQWRHWWFPTSCFGVTNHSEATSLWLVRQDRAAINSGSLPSCGAPFWQRSVASPSEIGWLASKVSRYLSILCLWSYVSSTECARIAEQAERCWLWIVQSVQGDNVCVYRHLLFCV